jgi:predicted nucleic acid-binding Zn ribbon protein
MQQQTFPDPAVAQRIANDFIPVLIDADEQPATVQQLGASEFPTMLVMSADSRVLLRATGFQSAAQVNTSLAAFHPTSFARKFQPATTQIANHAERVPNPTSFLRRFQPTRTQIADHPQRTPSPTSFVRKFQPASTQITDRTERTPSPTSFVRKFQPASTQVTDHAGPVPNPTSFLRKFQPTRVQYAAQIERTSNLTASLPQVEPSQTSFWRTHTLNAIRAANTSVSSR